MSIWTITVIAMQSYCNISVQTNIKHQLSNTKYEPNKL